MPHNWGFRRSWFGSSNNSNSLWKSERSLNWVAAEVGNLMWSQLLFKQSILLENAGLRDNKAFHENNNNYYNNKNW